MAYDRPQMPMPAWAPVNYAIGQANHTRDVMNNVLTGGQTLGQPSTVADVVGRVGFGNDLVRDHMTGGRFGAQQLVDNALRGGGASIQDIIARVAANRRMMQSSLQTPSGAVGYMGPPPTGLQRAY